LWETKRNWWATKEKIAKKIVGTKIKWGKQKNCGKQKKRLKKKLWEIKKKIVGKK
jgi:hypothetical protein